MVHGDLPKSCAPELTTPRLRLSAHRAADLADCTALWSDPVVVRYIGGRTFTEEEVWARILRYVGQWDTLAYGFWAIHETSTGRFVGEIGFGEFGRDLPPPFGEAPECGWALAPWAHGRGMASEALAKVLEWGDSHFPKETEATVCMIDPNNAPSIRLAERHDYVEFAKATYRDTPTILFLRRQQAPHVAPAPAGSGEERSGTG